MQSKSNNSNMAIVYSQILFELSQERNKVENYLNNSITIYKLYENKDYKKLNNLLSNLSFSVNEKEKIIDKLFLNKLDMYYLNFLKVLVSRNDYKYLPNILKKYIHLASVSLNEKIGIIYSVSKLDSLQISKIEKALSKKLDKKITLENKIDESLIAGIKIVFEDLEIDKTIKYKLQDISNILKN